MKNYLILGGGIAGRRAGETIRKHEADAEITIVEEQPNPFFLRPMLGDLLKRGLSDEKLEKRDREVLEKLGIKLLTGLKVTGLNPDEQEVSLNNGDKVLFDRLLIATGRKTRRFQSAPPDVSGVVYLDTLADVRKIEVLLKTVKKAVLTGASFQSLSALKGLLAKGIQCTLIIEQDRIWPEVLSPVASEIVESRILQEGVGLIKETFIRDIETEQSKLKGLLMVSGERISNDLLVVGTPQLSFLEYLMGPDMEAAQYVEVDEKLRTAHDTIFAAGDAALLPREKEAGAFTGEGWLRAWRQGNIAGINMTGGSESYLWPPSLRTKVFDLDVVCIGLSGAKGEGIKKEAGGYPYDEMPYIYKSIVFKDGKVAGAVFLGDVSEAGVVEQWVRKGLSREECDRKVLDQMFLPKPRELVAQGALCPVCKFQIQVDDQAREGAVVTCPACGIDFRLKPMANGVYRAVPDS